MLRQVLAATGPERKAQIAITFDLEMSRNFPTWERTEWDYEKGNLDSATKEYALAAGKRVKEHGGHIHYFAVGRVCEQPDVGWLSDLAAAGHPIGNHTYDHVNVLAREPEQIQFRFARAPWLIAGQAVPEVIAENVALCTKALAQRAKVTVNGFRTPGGFATGLREREDVQAMLQAQGFTWVSSLYPPHPNTMGEPPSEQVLTGIVAAQKEAQPFVYPSGLVEIPMSPISDVGAFRNGRWPLEAFIEAVRRGVLWAIENEGVYDFLAHPSCLGVVDSKLRTVETICQLVAEHRERAELTTLDQIAANITRAKG
jgi:peptidoglycan/xylan/chitin deacetylase (PgdA/CDA1 family)